MKKKSSLLIIVIFILNIIMFKPITCIAWDVENTSISNIVVRDGRLVSFDFHFEVPQNLGTTQSWLGIQAVKFDDSDLKDDGSIYGRYAAISDLKKDDNFLWDYKIDQFSKKSFSCFGEDHSNLTETLSDLSIDSDDSGTYYVYLWTQYGGSFYPDTLLATITFDNGLVTGTNPSGEEIINKTFENLEATVVDKVEIVDVNLKLTVGEKPTFSARIKNDSNKFDFEETFMSTDRSSTLQIDEDELAKDLKYFHICDVYIKDNVNLKFDENTKIYINGVEQSKDIIYVNSDWITISDEDNNLIIPERYIAPAYLDEEFENKQKESVNKTILEAAKADGVKYNNAETKNIVNAAIQNGSPIDFDLYISQSITKSLASYYFDDTTINALNNNIGKDYKFAAYYDIDILIYVNYYTDWITELSAPISLTIPYPNGVPTLSDGYEREWKLIRYHDGKIDILDAEKTENGISFENDKFSAFALVYKDVKTTEVNNPKTGDNIVLYIAILGISIIGLVGTGLFLKKKKN